MHDRWTELLSDCREVHYEIRVAPQSVQDTYVYRHKTLMHHVTAMIDGEPASEPMLFFGAPTRETVERCFWQQRSERADGRRDGRT
jgi:hypothetical protein